MKLLVTLLILGSFSVFSQDTISELPKAKRLSASFPKAEIMECECGCWRDAEYPGGSDALKRYIIDNLNISGSNNLNSGSEYTFYVYFIIMENGRIENVSTFKLDEPKIEEQVIAFFEQMPTWIPGESKNKTVKTRILIPVTLILGDPRYHG